MIKGVLFDLDGSTMVQGGPMAPPIAAVMRGLNLIAIPIGPCTGKSADYARGIAVGAGLHWKFISAEAGALFLVLENAGPPPIWAAKVNPSIRLEDLWLFRDLAGIDTLKGTFVFNGRPVPYRPEQKERILTLFPWKNPEESLEWISYFQEIKSNHRLGVSIKRHSDGGIDIAPAGVTKKLGVDDVCMFLNCTPKEILTVVDGTNDHELALGTTVIAVGNAVEDIKEIAQRQNGFVASLPHGWGFAEGLLYYARKSLFGDKSKAIEHSVLHHVPQADTKKAGKK